MNNRAREYRLLIDEIMADNERFKALGLALVEPGEWKQLHDVVANVMKKLEPKP
jgi:hypothetical protein